jgi:uncharacterized membrane protein
MSDAEFVILVLLFICGLYIFIRNVFNLSHKSTILTIITSAIGVYMGLIYHRKDKGGDE